MEELLKIAYRNFMDTKDMNNSEEVCIINKNWETVKDAIARLRDILNPSLFQNIDESIRDGIADVQEASFIAGFSYCAKFLTNGKIDFFPEKGGAC